MIREATRADITPLVDLAQALVTESPVFDTMTFDRTKTRIFLSWLQKCPNGILLVATEKEQIIGAMAGAISDHPFSYVKYAFDYGLFVYPEHRGKLAAARLVKEFERRAKALGAKDFRPGVMTNVQVLRTSMFYERLGYMNTGTQFIKELR